MSKHKITFKDYNNHLFIGKGLTVICQHVNTEHNAFYNLQQKLVKAYGTKKSNKLQSKPTIINTIQGINILGQCPDLDTIANLLKQVGNESVVLFTDDYMTLHYISQFAENIYNSLVLCPTITFACVEVYSEQTLKILALAGEEVPNALTIEYSNTLLDGHLKLKATERTSAMYDHAEKLEGLDYKIKQALEQHTSVQDLTEIQDSTIQYIQGFGRFYPEYDRKGQRVSTARAMLTNGFELSIKCFESGALEVISHYVQDNQVCKPVIFKNEVVLLSLDIQLDTIIPTIPICNLLKLIGFKFADNFIIL